jgi:glycosyltransferase involved in cell wall biosynthesis
MNVAIVHELLTRRGGAERVAKVFADMFPDAPVYTLLYDEQKLGDWFPRERVKESEALPASRFLLPARLRFNHHLYLSRFPSAVEAWDFSAFDLVISSSSAFAHGIITNGKPRHLSYVHSPARYLWDSTHDVLERADRGLLGPLKRTYLEHVFHKLRIWDAEVAPRPDALVANSREVQRRIELYWRRESAVIHPPVEPFWFEGDLSKKKEDFFLVVSTLAHYKNVELAIAACNNLNVPLKIVGEGPDRRRLESLAGPSIEFLGYQSNDVVRELYSHARAVLFPTHDDFGLVPVEAMACGATIVARRAGGALETVQENKTGIFFSSEQELQNVLRTVESFDPAACREHAKQFHRDIFEQKIREAVDAL